MKNSTACHLKHLKLKLQLQSGVVKDLRLQDKDLWLENKDKDCTWSKDKDLSSRTRTKTCKLVLQDPREQGLFLEDNNTGLQ